MLKLGEYQKVPSNTWVQVPDDCEIASYHPEKDTYWFYIQSYKTISGNYVICPKWGLNRKLVGNLVESKSSNFETDTNRKKYYYENRDSAMRKANELAEFVAGTGIDENAFSFYT